MKKKTGWDTAVVISDWHVPFHDPKALNLAFTMIWDIQPEYVFCDGDLLDFYDISRFCKDPLNSPGLQFELDATYNLLKKLREGVPMAQIYYIDGNHEFRLASYLMNNAQELVGLTRACDPDSPALSLPSLLRLKELKITHISSGRKESQYWFGTQLLIGHFNRVNKHSGYTAKNLLEDKHMSLIQGHTHRLGSSYKTVRVGKGKHRVIAAYENGCLCNLDPEYVTDPNWQQGFSIVHKKRGGDRFNVQQIPIIDYVAFYGGKEYRAT